MANIVVDGTIGANRLLILDSTGKIPAVDGSQITAIAAGSIATGTIPIARIDTGSTANKIVVLDGSGRLPAVSAALITNIPGATKSASDPVIATNPSGGVGSEWHNTTSGEVYICTDATAGANVWTNVGAGSGDIVPWSFQGSAFGYVCGGAIAGSNNKADSIEKNSFTTDGNTVDVSNLNLTKASAGGASSLTHGYMQGGITNTSTGADTNAVEKHQFATTNDGTDVGDLVQQRGACAGQSSGTYGYNSGGQNVPSPTQYNNIEKTNFATDGNSTDVGDLTAGRTSPAGQSSLTYGFTSGGSDMNIIDRFSFASDGNATDWADLTIAHSYRSGQSSTTYGYTSGGNTSNVIEKYPFASQTNASDVGDLLFTSRGFCGASSTGYGYHYGGYPYHNAINKFSFSSDGNATDVGDLLSNRDHGCGLHY